VATLRDLEASLRDELFARTQGSRPRCRRVGAAGSFVALNNVVSQSVPHLQCAVVPRNPKDGLRGFFWPRPRYADDAEMASYGSIDRVELEADFMLTMYINDMQGWFAGRVPADWFRAHRRSRRSR